MYGEPDLAPELRQRLLVGLDFPFAEAGKLVTSFLPQLEKVLPLDDGAERSGNLDEVGVGNIWLHRAEMAHDRRIHPAEAKHRNRAQLRPA